MASGSRRGVTAGDCAGSRIARSSAQVAQRGTPPYSRVGNVASVTSQSWHDRGNGSPPPRVNLSGGVTPRPSLLKTRRRARSYRQARGRLLLTDRPASRLSAEPAEPVAVGTMHSGACHVARQ